MDSGVSIRTFLCVEKCWACFSLLLASTLRWGLGIRKQATVKPERFYLFPPFLLRSLTEETRYKRPELGLLKGLVFWLNQRESDRTWIWKEWQDLFASLFWKNGGDLLLVDWGRLWRSHWGRVFMPSSPGVGSKMTLEPLLLDFPLPGENDGYYLGWNDPHWGGSCRSL